jgi:hypothetical protein
MNCKDCQNLIPSYVDEELSDSQAAPLRQHLMDCRLCRRTLLGEKAFKRWFSQEIEPAVAVPSGFAERVARRAFAGDAGSDAITSLESELDAEVPTETPLFQFVLRSTAVAAGLLLVVSLLIFSNRIPDGTSVRAKPAPENKEELLRGLDRLQDPAQSPGTGAGVEGESILQDMSELSEPDAAADQQ